MLGARLNGRFAAQALLLERQSRALQSLAELDVQERGRAADAVSRWQVHWIILFILTGVFEYASDYESVPLQVLDVLHMCDCTNKSESL